MQSLLPDGTQDASVCQPAVPGRSYIAIANYVLNNYYRMVGNFRGVQLFVDFVCSAYPQKLLN